MRKLVVTEYVSLDGVMEEPSWTAPYWNGEIASFKFEELFASDTLLLGRITYEGFAKAWPAMKDEQGFADRMNTMPKFVASSTLDKAEWNATIIKGDLVEEIKALKQQDGGDILVYGSGALVESLMEAGLVDEYRLLVYPVVLGKGKPFFKAGSKATLKLAETQTFSSGVVALIYHPAQAE